MTKPADPPTIRLLCVDNNPDDVELMAIAMERADPHRRYVLQRVYDAVGFMSRFSPYAALQILWRGAAARRWWWWRAPSAKKLQCTCCAALRGHGLSDQGQAGHSRRSSSA